MSVLEQTKIIELSRDMRLYHDAWIVLLRIEMTMRCNVVMSHTSEHTRVGGVYGQKSLDST